jgi:invasin-like protein/calcineurin-like phosphoesterase family protein
MRKPRLLLTAAASAVLLGLITCSDDTAPTESPLPEPAGMEHVTPTGMKSVIAPKVFVGAGDISKCSNNGDEATAQLLDAIPGTVYTVGDNAYEDGNIDEFNDCYAPTWGRHKDRTRPSAGNVDYNTPNAAPYFAYFGAAAGNPGEGYYSFNLGAWHIVVLNSNVARTASSPQGQWLRADLAANPSLCTLAYFHHPLYSSTSGSGSGGAVWGSVRPFWDTLYAKGVDLVLGGHRHFYERLAPMKPDGSPDEASGMREFVTGMGGVSGGTITNLFPTSEVRNGDTRGVLKFHLYEDSYAWKFVPIAGKTFTDTGSTACHPAPGSGGGGPGISPSLSTVSADPTSFTAGSGTSTITVTARNTNGDPVSGANVILSATGSGNVVTQPSGPTDGSGVATGALGATGAEIKTVSAVISGIAITQTASVTVNAGAPSAAQSTVGASPASITAGTGTSTITVTVRDQHGNPVSGSTVALAATGTGNTLTQPGAQTDGSGVATGTLSSTEAGVKTVSATADGTAIAQTADVTVQPQGTGTIVHTLLTSGNGTVNGTVFTTASISPAPNTLVTVAVLGHRSPSAPNAPTLSGGGMTTWTQVASITFDNLTTSLKRLTIYRAMSPTPGSGPLTITFPNNVSNSQWIVSQWSGVDQSGTNGAGAIAQTATNRADAVSNLTATLAPFGSASNVAYGVVAVNGGGLVVTPGTGFIEIAEHTSGEAAKAVLEAERAADDNTVAASWTGGLNGAILGVELKVEVGP